MARIREDGTEESPPGTLEATSPPDPDPDPVKCHKKFGKYDPGTSDRPADDEEVCLPRPDSPEPEPDDIAPRFLRTFSRSCSLREAKPTRPVRFDSESLSVSSDASIDLTPTGDETRLPDPLLNVIRTPDPRRDRPRLSDDFDDETDDVPSENLREDEKSESGIENDDAIASVETLETNATDSAAYCVGLFEERSDSSPKAEPVRDESSGIGRCIYNDEFSEFEARLSLTLCQNSLDRRDSSVSSLDSVCDRSATRNVPASKSKTRKTKEKTTTKKTERRKPRKKKSSPSPRRKKKDKISTDTSPDSINHNDPNIRRSSRIQTIGASKQRSKGRGLVGSLEKKFGDPSDAPEVGDAGFVNGKLEENSSATGSKVTGFSMPFGDSEIKPVKVKSRWRRSSEMEMGSCSPIAPSSNGSAADSVDKKLMPREVSGCVNDDSRVNNLPMIDSGDADGFIAQRLSQFEIIYENIYHCDKNISKEARKMICDCFLTKEEIERGELGCGEDCLNRLLMIECNSRCPVGSRCTNRRFQQLKYSNLKVINTEKKGLGIQAVRDIPGGEFLMEYVGEVLNSKQFHQRAGEYSSDKNTHHYFMALKGDAVIDATLKGNVSRFINHSCDPNSETQKWTVKGELRIGFFSKRNIKAGEEVTFDYQFQRYGKEAQKCYCEASNCRGWIGEEPSESESEGEEEEESEEEKEILATKEEKIDDLKKLPDEQIAVDDAKRDVAKKKGSVKVVKSESAKKRGRPKKVSHNVKELLQDVDLKEDMERLTRSGIKNQSHTLSLCRSMVRAKLIDARKTLLSLLANADLPCRRLFLDYRGLKLLSPWCEEANADFRLCLLRVLDKLPIPNKTIIQECKLMLYIERWLNDSFSQQSTPNNDDSSDTSRSGTPLIDELNMNSRMEEKIVKNNAIVYQSNEQKEKIIKYCKHLLERWSKLKEEFKIPKKERVQLMKEHERQANETRIKSDHERRSSKDSERWEERYSRHDRDRKRIKVLSPDSSRRSHSRHEERILSAIPPMSKEARRREFAARVALEEQMKQNAITSPIVPAGSMIVPHGQWVLSQPYGMQHPAYSGMIVPTASVAFAQPYYQQLATYTHPTAHDPSAHNSSHSNLKVVPNYPAYLSNAPQPIPSLTPPVPLPYPTQIHLNSNVENQHNYNVESQPNHVFPVNVKTENEIPEKHLKTKECKNSVDQESKLKKKYVTHLPSQWRAAVDNRGRTYFYHVQLRVSQWEPPLQTPDESDDDEKSDEEKEEIEVTNDFTPKLVEGVDGIYQVLKENKPSLNGLKRNKSGAYVRRKKHRPKLVTEWFIDPRTEEDKAANKIQLQLYKDNKEKLRRRKELAQMASSSSYRRKERPNVGTVELRKNEDNSKKIKDVFLSSMARVIVYHLNPYRREDCLVGRITSTADFKYLAKKLTHFVMFKELKHCKDVNELHCNSSVKLKAKDFVKKYMLKFGPIYQRPPEEMDH